MGLLYLAIMTEASHFTSPRVAPADTSWGMFVRPDRCKRDVGWSGCGFRPKVRGLTRWYPVAGWSCPHVHWSNPKLTLKSGWIAVWACDIQHFLAAPIVDFFEWWFIPYCWCFNHHEIPVMSGGALPSLGGSRCVLKISWTNSWKRKLSGFIWIWICYLIRENGG